MEVRHLERIPTERAAFLIGSINGTSANVLASLDHPDVTTARVAPDWDRAYLFAADSEAALHTPGVPELF
jgi:sn-glycerol 3-phosphate transport system ATP-binding protein/multiple sugar transport system ATP-binding protein